MMGNGAKCIILVILLFFMVGGFTVPLYAQDTNDFHVSTGLCTFTYFRPFALDVDSFSDIMGYGFFTDLYSAAKIELSVMMGINNNYGIFAPSLRYYFLPSFEKLFLGVGFFMSSGSNHFFPELGIKTDLFNWGIPLVALIRYSFPDGYLSFSVGIGISFFKKK